MDDADPAGLRHRDRDSRLGDRVHRRGDDRQVEADRRVSCVPILVALGMTALNPGRSRTSSNARPSGIEFGSTTTAIAFIPRRIEGADGIKRHPPYGGAA